MKLIDTAQKMMNECFEEDAVVSPDTIIGVFLLAVCSLFGIAVSIFAIVTVPVWGLPYLLIKSYGERKENEDE